MEPARTHAGTTASGASARPQAGTALAAAGSGPAAALVLLPGPDHGDLRSLLVAAAIVVVLGLLAYWLLAVTEGAWLGPTVVTRLYDRDAPRYHAAKRLLPHEEARHIANPLLDRIEVGQGLGALVLDVATGTGRVPAALLAMPHFQGSVVGLDLSGGMLAEAAANLAPWSDRAPLVRSAATPLPFANAAFDAVVMLEALEFMPDRDAALREMLRVLAPGGTLLVSNRRGLDRWLLVGRVDSAHGLVDRLRRAGAQGARLVEWQPLYDLVWASAPGQPRLRSPDPDAWRGAVRCPGCGSAGSWDWSGEQADCRRCRRRITLRGGVWDLRRRRDDA